MAVRDCGLTFSGNLYQFFGRKKGEGNRDVFVLVVMVMEFTGMPCLYPVNSLTVFSWAGFREMGMWLGVDGFKWLYSITAASMWTVTTLSSMEYFTRHDNRGRYCFFSLLACGAAMGVFLSNSLLSLFLSFEIMRLTSFVMVVQEEIEAAGRAARTYLAITVIGGLYTLFGIFMIAAGTGSLSVNNLEQFRKAIGGMWSLYLTGALLLVGFGAKAGVHPLHTWLPNAHPVVPTPASALLSGILTKTGAFGVLVVTMTMFRYDMVRGMMPLASGAVTMVLGAILAVFSIGLKRTLTRSSIFQVGFILAECTMQCPLGEENGLAASGTVLHMVNHSMIKLVPSTVAECIYMDLHRLGLNEIRGYGRNKPLPMLVFVMGAYGIRGIPLLSGYVSETLPHESIVEYIEVLGAQGVDALPFQMLEWASLLAGGPTVTYIAELFAAISLEKVPTGRERGDRKKRHAGTVACSVLGGPACLPPLMGTTPHQIADHMTDISHPFLRGVQVPRQVKYPSGVNLRGACVNVTVGVLVYVLFTHRYLMETGEDGTRVYVGRWPAWLDLEDRVYRPLILAVLPFLGAVLVGYVNGICESPLPLFMKRPEKNQAVAPGESNRFFRQAQGVRLLRVTYSNMGYGFMMLGTGLILMTVHVLFL